jgi:hypothetical protein
VKVWLARWMNDERDGGIEGVFATQAEAEKSIEWTEDSKYCDGWVVEYEVQEESK